MAMRSGAYLPVPETSGIIVVIGDMRSPLFVATCCTRQTARAAACCLPITRRCGSTIVMFCPGCSLETPCIPLARRRGLAFVRRPLLAQPPAPRRSLCAPAIVTGGLPAIVTRWFCAYPVAVEVRFQDPELLVDPAREVRVERRTARILDLRGAGNGSRSAVA